MGREKTGKRHISTIKIARRKLQKKPQAATGRT
jgi:hypothetical protein